MSLAAALRGTGHEVTETPAGLQVGADAETVGRLALAHGIVLVALHRTERAGLEELFLTLTAATDRAGHVAHQNGAAA